MIVCVYVYNCVMMFVCVIQCFTDGAAMKGWMCGCVREKMCVLQCYTGHMAAAMIENLARCSKRSPLDVLTHSGDVSDPTVKARQSGCVLWTSGLSPGRFRSAG